MPEDHDHFKPIVYEQTGNSDRNLLIPYGKFDN